jgi:dihydroxy-acid dehydratase
MFHALGLTEEDLKKPQVGIVSTGYEGNPCNVHLNKLAKEVKKGTLEKELIGLIFNTIGVSDGISMGTPGMRYSLPSREVIADSIETVVQAQNYDGLIAVVGCDKNLPGALMAMLRLNRPSLLVYGGSIASGCLNGKKLNIVSAFEALGEKTAGSLSQKEFKSVVKSACPGPGACGGMYTANTMASAIEALGISLPNSASMPAVGNNKKAECNLAGQQMQFLLKKDIKPLDIVTKKSFENATRVAIALGGSTNATIHLLAAAHTAGIDFTLEDIQEINNTTPYLADLKPSGKYLMEDVYRAGGLQSFMKYLLEKGLLHGDCLTITGKTLAENLKDTPPLNVGQKVFQTVENPIKETGHLQILFGNLAEKGSVAKITGKEGNLFNGPAKVFDSEDEANSAILNKKVEEGDVVVIRYVGPKGGPGMPEMLKPTSAIMGAGLGNQIALITDGRFSGGTHGFVVGHICPEAAEGGTIALLKNGDYITIDAKHNKIEAQISTEELSLRKALWKPKETTGTTGYLRKYAKAVSNASTGCLTDF